MCVYLIVYWSQSNTRIVLINALTLSWNLYNSCISKITQMKTTTQRYFLNECLKRLVFNCQSLLSTLLVEKIDFYCFSQHSFLILPRVHYCYIVQYKKSNCLFFWKFLLLFCMYYPSTSFNLIVNLLYNLYLL